MPNKHLDDVWLCRLSVAEWIRSQTMSQNRTLKTLGALVGGMTLLSGLLMAIEPGPVDAPSTALSAFDTTREPTRELFQTVRPRDWQRMIIHASPVGFRGDSEAELNQFYRQQGVGEGAGYHFVVRRRAGEPLEISARWRQQQAGAFLFDPSRDQRFVDQLNATSIGICLIGDGVNEPFTEEQQQQLFWLVRQLSEQLGVPADQILAGEGVGPLFPHNKLRQLQSELAQGG